MKCQNKKSGLTLAILLSLFLLLPLTVSAYPGAAPDGTGSLLQIFPGPDSPALATEIGENWLEVSTDYIPASAGEFDDIETISLPGEEVRYIYGLQYLHNLAYLNLSGNLLTDETLEILPQLRQLIHLDLSMNEITSGTIRHLASLPLEYLNLAGTDVSGEQLELLPTTLRELDISSTFIHDEGAGKIGARLTGLTELRCADADLGDEGAMALAGMANRSAVSLDLTFNHIGFEGIHALVRAGFRELKLDNQEITEPEIASGRLPILHSLPVDPAQSTISDISDGGVYDTATGAITWPERTSDNLFHYRLRILGYPVTVFVPYRYTPFRYKVTFDDRMGGKRTVAVWDLEKVAHPKDPVRKNYVFMGWSTDANEQTPFDFSAPITENMTLYASWDKNVYDSDEDEKGDGSGENEDETGKTGGDPVRGGASPDTADPKPVYIMLGMLFTAGAGLLVTIVLRREITIKERPRLLYGGAFQMVNQHKAHFLKAVQAEYYQFHEMKKRIDGLVEQLDPGDSGRRPRRHRPLYRKGIPGTGRGEIRDDRL